MHKLSRSRKQTNIKRSWVGGKNGMNLKSDYDRRKWLQRNDAEALQRRYDEWSREKTTRRRQRKSGIESLSLSHKQQHWCKLCVGCGRKRNVLGLNTTHKHCWRGLPRPTTHSHLLKKRNITINLIGWWECPNSICTFWIKNKKIFNWNDWR